MIGRRRREPPSELAQARAALEGTERVRGAAVRESEQARDGLAQANAAVTSAAHAVTQATNAFRDTGTDRAARALAKAREAHELARLRADRPRERSIAADAALETATAAVCRAQAEVERIERDGHISELRARASVATYRAEVLPMARDLLALRAELAAKAGEVDAALERSRAASAELRELGVDCPEAHPLGDEHAVLPLVAVVAAEEPSRTAGLLGLLERFGVMADRFPVGRGLIACTDVPVVSFIERQPMSAPAPADGARLEARLEARTLAEGRAAAGAIAVSSPAPAAPAEPRGWILRADGSREDFGAPRRLIDPEPPPVALLEI